MDSQLDLSAIAAELEARVKAEATLYEFFKQAWHVIEPGYQFVDNWHIGAVAEHLQAVTEGQIKNILINFPPRDLKTDTGGVAWPAWEWIRHPNRKFLYGSYSWTLAEDASIKCRQLIKSGWYQTRWGDRFSIIDDRDKKDHFANDRGGERIITSPDSTMTGRGGDRVVCLPAETLIATENGPLQIGEIVDGRLPVRVACFDHEADEVTFSAITEYEKSPGRSLIEIETSSGAVVRLTEDHPVFVSGRGYIPAADVRPGDEVLET